jgi:hypothetical protein
MFTFGCRMTIGTAVVQLIGHVAGPQAPANDTERQLLELATTYRYALPGGTERSLMDFVDGFSLMLPVMLVAIGVAGIVVQKRGRHDLALMLGIARTFAVTSVVLLALSLLKFFIVPTMCFAAMATCFLVASVEGPVES